MQGAPGRELILSRVVVEPGAKLASHRHLGSQVARVRPVVIYLATLLKKDAPAATPVTLPPGS